MFRNKWKRIAQELREECRQREEALQNYRKFHRALADYYAVRFFHHGGVTAYRSHDELQGGPILYGTIMVPPGQACRILCLSEEASRFLEDSSAI